jgi:hypothetical protein
MSAASAAILRWTLSLEPKEVSRRRARARDLLSRVRGNSNTVAVRTVTGGESGFLRLVLIDKSGTRTARPDLGALRGYPMTLDQHPQLEKLLLPGERAGKGSQSLRDGLFTLPTHSHVGDSDLARLTDWLEVTDLESRVLIPAS